MLADREHKCLSGFDALKTDGVVDDVAGVIRDQSRLFRPFQLSAEFFGQDARFDQVQAKRIDEPLMGLTNMWW